MLNFNETEEDEMKVEITKFKDVDLKGATVIDGFSAIGLVGSIVANYLIHALKLDQIAALDSPDFPPVSLVYASKPKLPARIYADEKLKLVVFLSEFTPTPKLARPIAQAILSWSKENSCLRIISPEGIPAMEDEERLERLVYGVCSTDCGREELKKINLAQLDRGIISGVSGVLLNEGRKTGFDVICLLVKMRAGIPDAEAAAKIIEQIDKLVPNIKIDVAPLYEEAKRIEEYLKLLRKQAKPSEPEAPSRMYG